MDLWLSAYGKRLTRPRKAADGDVSGTPPVLVYAISSTEDKHFFHHRCLDLARVAEAAYVASESLVP
jgi:membrane peptidoglycan carboxypeptidase